MKIDPASITDQELRDQYAQTRLAHSGIAFERAITLPGIRTSLMGAAKAARRVAMRRARANPNNYEKDAA